MKIISLYIILISLCGFFVFLSFKNKELYRKLKRRGRKNKQEITRNNYNSSDAKNEKNFSASNCIFSNRDNYDIREGAQSLKEINRILVKISEIGKPRLQYDKHFKRYISFWKEECIDTTRAALISLRLQGKRDFIENNQNKILKFVEECFNSNDGAYSITPREIPSIYATSNAIEVMKEVLLIEKDEKFINGGVYKDELVEFELKNGGIYEFEKKKIAFIENFINKTRNEFLIICDELEDRSSDAICVIYLAWRLLWNLDKENIFNDLIPYNELQQYIERCYRKGGFASRIQQKEPSVANTYFALSLIKNLYNNSRLYSEIHKKFFCEKKDEICSFLNGCWDKQTGGFKSSLIDNDAPSLNSTYFAIYTIKKLLGNTSCERKEFIKKFVRDCYCNGGGFAFTKEEYLTPKRPLAHGVRWTFQINKFFEDSILEEYEKNESIHFLEKLYDSDKGGFAGFYISDSKKVKESINSCFLLNEE